MNLLNKTYAWILNNYIKVIVFFLIIGLSYGVYLYFYFAAQKKDQAAGDSFLNFYNSYLTSNFDEQLYENTLENISQIDSASIYLVMLKSIHAAEFVEKNNLQKALIELSKAQEILSTKSNDFNFLKEIIDLRIVSIFIDSGDLDRAKNILNNTFTTYQVNKLIFQGDISVLENKVDNARQKYSDALRSSENESQKNLINLKISTLSDS